MEIGSNVNTLSNQLVKLGSNTSLLRSTCEASAKQQHKEQQQGKQNQLNNGIEDANITLLQHISHSEVHHLRRIQLNMNEQTSMGMEEAKLGSTASSTLEPTSSASSVVTTLSSQQHSQSIRGYVLSPELADLMKDVEVELDAIRTFEVHAANPPDIQRILRPEVLAQLQAQQTIEKQAPSKLASHSSSTRDEVTTESLASDVIQKVDSIVTQQNSERRELEAYLKSLENLDSELVTGLEINYGTTDASEVGKPGFGLSKEVEKESQTNKSLNSQEQHQRRQPELRIPKRSTNILDDETIDESTLDEETRNLRAERRRQKELLSSIDLSNRERMSARASLEAYLTTLESEQRKLEGELISRAQEKTISLPSEFDLGNQKPSAIGSLAPKSEEMDPHDNTTNQNEASPKGDINAEDEDRGMAEIEELEARLQELELRGREVQERTEELANQSGEEEEDEDEVLQEEDGVFLTETQIAEEGQTPHDSSNNSAIPISTVFKSLEKKYDLVSLEDPSSSPERSLIDDMVERNESLLIATRLDKALEEVEAEMAKKREAALASESSKNTSQNTRSSTPSLALSNEAMERITMLLSHEERVAIHALVEEALSRSEDFFTPSSGDAFAEDRLARRRIDEIDLKIRQLRQDSKNSSIALRSNRKRSGITYNPKPSAAGGTPAETISTFSKWTDYRPFEATSRQIALDSDLKQKLRQLQLIGVVQETQKPSSERPFHSGKESTAKGKKNEYDAISSELAHSLTNALKASLLEGVDEFSKYQQEEHGELPLVRPHLTLDDILATLNVGSQVQESGDIPFLDENDVGEDDDDDDDKTNEDQSSRGGKANQSGKNYQNRPDSAKSRIRPVSRGMEAIARNALSKIANHVPLDYIRRDIPVVHSLYESEEFQRSPIRQASELNASTPEANSSLQNALVPFRPNVEAHIEDDKEGQKRLSNLIEFSGAEDDSDKFIVEELRLENEGLKRKFESAHVNPRGKTSFGSNGAQQKTKNSASTFLTTDVDPDDPIVYPNAENSGENKNSELGENDENQTERQEALQSKDITNSAVSKMISGAQAKFSELNDKLGSNSRSKVQGSNLEGEDKDMLRSSKLAELSTSPTQHEGYVVASEHERNLRRLRHRIRSVIGASVEDSDSDDVEDDGYLDRDASTKSLKDETDANSQVKPSPEEIRKNVIAAILRKNSSGMAASSITTDYTSDSKKDGKGSNSLGMKSNIKIDEDAIGDDDGYFTSDSDSDFVVEDKEAPDRNKRVSKFPFEKIIKPVGEPGGKTKVTRLTSTKNLTESYENDEDDASSKSAYVDNEFGELDNLRWLAKVSMKQTDSYSNATKIDPNTRDSLLEEVMAKHGSKHTSQSMVARLDILAQELGELSNQLDQEEMEAEGSSETPIQTLNVGTSSEEKSGGVSSLVRSGGLSRVNANDQTVVTLSSGERKNSIKRADLQRRNSATSKAVKTLPDMIGEHSVNLGLAEELERALLSMSQPDPVKKVNAQVSTSAATSTEAQGSVKSTTGNNSSSVSNHRTPLSLPPVRGASANPNSRPTSASKSKSSSNTTARITK